jgi:hypothetical protein
MRSTRCEGRNDACLLFGNLGNSRKEDKNADMGNLLRRCDNGLCQRTLELKEAASGTKTVAFINSKMPSKTRLFNSPVNTLASRMLTPLLRIDTALDCRDMRS